MKFEKETDQLLRGPLNPEHVETRKQGGSQVPYVTAWHAIAEANRIFGFGGWDRTVVWQEQTYSNPEEEKRNGGTHCVASWLCRVRVCVRNETGTVVREGTGSGTGFGYNLGEAHESALKEAESDAMKRALVTFGSQFGLALYDKRRAEVAAPQEMATASQRRQISNLLGKTAVPREQWGELIEDLSGRDGLRSGDVASVASKLQGMIDGEDVEDVEPEPQESRAQAKKWIGDAVALESRDARIDFFRYLEEGGAGSRIKRLVAAVFKSAEGADYDPGDMAAAESLIGIPIADRSEAAS